MNKKLLLLFLSGVIVSGTFAQIKLGAFIGVHNATVIETNNIPDWQTTTKPYYSSKTGMKLGVMADIPMGKGFYFQPGINYTSQGRKFAENFDTSNMTKNLEYPVYQNTSLNLSYIEIPLSIAYKIFLSSSHKNSFFISAGPYVAFQFSSKLGNQSLYVKKPNDTTSNYTFNNNTDDLPIGNGVNKYKTLDLGVILKGGFEFGNVVLSGYWSRGLTSFYEASYDGTFHHQLVGASLGIWLAKTEPSTPAKVKPKDTDKDGVTDDIDLCPKVPGFAKYNGCPIPDTDKDGIDDEHDSCKTVAGIAKYHGCPIPDTDADGINDEVDKCPSVAGVAKYNGCPIPDTDGDGVNDDEDSCKTVAGLAKYHGCPIPDTDGDGINDEEDKCPTVAGVAENNGCPAIKKEIKEKVNYVAHHVLFATASDKLTTDSYIRLDELAAILKKNDDLNILIEGYTDTVGTPERNMVLSQKRADAVKNYLIFKGISQERITSIGHGQEQPIADNSTEKGRTANRRVEIKLTSK